MPTLLLALLASPAQAQSLTVHDGWLIEPVEGTVTENGIGSPTVAYDRANDRWVMYFETQFGPADDDCRAGRWGVGRATSPDGLTWTVDDELVLVPEADTFHGCVVAHPTVLFDGDTWHLWFKAHQANTACDAPGPKPPWGCEPVSGVGYARSSDGVDFTVGGAPVLDLSAFGFPTVTKVDGVLRMLLAFSNDQSRVYELWQSISTDDGLTWSDPTLVVRPGTALWVEDEIYNPSITCQNGGTFRYILWAGGRDTEPQTGGPPVTRTAGLGRAFSSDSVAWPWDANNPYMHWNLDPEAGPVDKDWRHWDVVRVGDEHLLFFSQRNDEGRNRIGLAYTFADQQASFQEARISNRICDLAVDTDVPDTGHLDPDETDPALPSDSDPATPGPGDTHDPDLVGPGGDDGCGGCATGGGAASLAPLVILAALRRRSTRPA